MGVRSVAAAPGGLDTSATERDEHMRHRLLTGDKDLGPKCFNPGTQAAIASRPHTLPRMSDVERQRVAAVEHLFGRVTALRDQCIAGGHTAADFRQALMEIL